ncbi:glycosyltransferase [Candidatus Galacturonibacter soehngenii]|uniref:Glycosyltransferase n=1 Tax=Candidatus Galacturonatibacter soehngenii TaxID=2307010 RepID=A0A7V7QL22_9FIRM|nr:glycosyltransferase [Candidatus Galacturonibacter soehngenii]KAB1438226.1 glycosyltransferase [Candidatus Galacturonibacter soehngenii]
MKNVLFVKYNRTRRLEFQISTCVFEEGGKTIVQKKALNEQAIPHIQSLRDKSEQIKKVMNQVHVLIPSIEEGIASYEYIEGNTLQDSLFRVIENKEELLEKIKSVQNKIFDFHSEYLEEFQESKRFIEIFGEAKKIQGMAINPANIDCLFDNFIEKDGVIYCLDCEWVVDCLVPVEYLKYRSVFYFYQRYRMYLEKYMTEDKFLAYFGYTQELADAYFEMEDHYQHYAHGENRQYIYTDNYKKPIKSRDNLGEEGFDLSSFKMLQEKDKDIEHLNELCYIKDNTISDKDKYIQDLEAIIQKMRSNPMYKIGRAPVKAAKTIRGLFQKKNHKLEKIVFPFIEKPQVSIIIPVYNQFDYTYKCLKSILEHTKDVTYEIIIGDDVSTDLTRKLSNYVANVIIKRNNENLGFVRNCNQAAKAARGNYILFLNNDTTVTNNWLKPLVEQMEADERIGLTGSKLVYPNGILQEAGGVIWSNADGWNYGRNDLCDKPEYNYVKEVDYISGAAMMIRSSLWNLIGGFDERFAPAYYEDTDLAFSVRKEGYKVVYQPKSVVIHYEGISNGTDTSDGIKKYQIENKEKFKEKWALDLEKQCKNPNELFIARDRSMNKKIAVFIDRYVPQFDKDAGSKSTLAYIRAFLKMGYQVKFIPEDFKADDVYSVYLEQLGVEVLTGSFYLLNVDKWLMDYGKHIDVVFSNRPYTTFKFLDVLKKSIKGKLIYYGHDLHYKRELLEYSFTRDKSLLAHANHMKQLEYSIMEQADVVYYPSYLEIEEIEKVNSKINAYAIPVFVYDEPRKIQPLDANVRKNLLFVGGFAHEPNVDAVVWFVQEILPKVLCSIPDVVLQVIGSNPPDKIMNLASDHVVIRGFVSEEELEKAYLETRMVVVPLRFGAGMKGKVIEALYYQIPVMTTSVGAQGLLEYHDVMRVEDAANAFANELVHLYQDTNTLNQMSQCMPEYIEKYFSLEAAQKILDHTINQD